MISQNNNGVVLLAAGKSSRLGEAKQLLTFEGQSFVRRAALIALQVSDKVIVVTGAQEDKIKTELSGLKLFTSFNKNHEEGIASSIISGLAAMQEKFPETEAVLFIVCDQPYVSSTILHRLIEKANQTGKPIVACSYANTLGIPVFFQKKYFPLLSQLKDDQGAKKIIQTNPDDVATIDFPEGVVDIDSIDDYEALTK
jgi:molybdenum cofactor cytidylyltransferase